MKLVIDILKKDYDKMCKGELVNTILVAIKNGVLLPKEHGRLGDLDELEQRITRYVEHHKHMMDEMVLLQENFIIDGIKQTPTIVEAERNDKNDNRDCY